MCTSLKYKQCFGRNFDYEISYNEQLINISQNEFNNDYKIIGVTTGLTDEYPLLYDGMNEQGLCCSGLAFTNNAHYYNLKDVPSEMEVYPSYDFTFRILGHFKTVKEVKKHLENACIINEPYSREFQNSDLHWHIADKEDSIIIEQTIDGLQVYDGEVLTNNPPYPLQLENYDEEKEYVGICAYKNNEWFTRGMETDNLCGGYTSEERFIRVSYLKEQLEKITDKFNTISETFHLLQSVEQVYGATPVENKFEYTIYSIVYDMKNKKTFIKTYNNLYPIEYDINEKFQRIILK